MNDDTNEWAAGVAANLATRLQVALTAERREHARTRVRRDAAEGRELDTADRIGRALTLALNTRDKHRSKHARDIADRIARILTPKDVR